MGCVHCGASSCELRGIRRPFWVPRGASRRLAHELRRVTTIAPLRGIHYSPVVGKLDNLLSPPYDVISDEERRRLVARDPHNIVRVDHPSPQLGDLPGVNDPYARAGRELEAWLEAGILVGDPSPSVYVTDHEFTSPLGHGMIHRLGILALAPALPWDCSPIRPHEKTLAGPKEDRLELMRRTRANTSPIFVMWDGAPDVRPLLEEIVAGSPLLVGETSGELGPERHRLWRVDSAPQVDALLLSLAPATLYIADGHHRYETTVAYLQERARGGDDGAHLQSPRVLSYLCDAGDPGLIILATHRLVRPGATSIRRVEDLSKLLDSDWNAEPVSTPSGALELVERSRRRGENALTGVALDGLWVLSKDRGNPASTRTGLDVSILHDEILPLVGIGSEAVEHGGLGFTRDPEQAASAVTRGEAALAFLVAPPGIADVIAVADAGETMPQKSTYFYPKVPTGLAVWRVE